MTFVADLHLHSPYAYATSKNLTLENLTAWAKLKGIQLLATADFTHPRWFQELRSKLGEASPGIYQFNGVSLALGTEVSCVYQQGGQQRRIHILLLAPDLATVERLNQQLAPYGSLESDGRPTLGVSCRDLTAMVFEVNPQCIVIPAHVWTPWYGVYGSKSGFDRLADCFLDLMPHIHAVETGLSSDPEMNWMVPELDGKTIVSFSDAHSLPKMGRELTVFDGELGYQSLSHALQNQGVAYTVEFYPQEGKYHYDGHRKCGVRLSPEEAQQQRGQCPVCRRPLTLGVLHRVRALSRETGAATPDEAGFIRSSRGRPPFIRLVPLVEIIAEARGQGVTSKGVQAERQRITQELGNELRVLVEVSAAELEVVAGERITEGVLKGRHGDIVVEPGYDGVFGKVRIWPDSPAAADKSASYQPGLPGV